MPCVTVHVRGLCALRTQRLDVTNRLGALTAHVRGLSALRLQTVRLSALMVQTDRQRTQCLHCKNFFVDITFFNCASEVTVL